MSFYIEFFKKSIQFIESGSLNGTKSLLLWIAYITFFEHVRTFRKPFKVIATNMQRNRQVDNCGRHRVRILFGPSINSLQ